MSTHPPWGHTKAEASSEGNSQDMFFLFSNRLGCLGSILVSLVVTGILILLLSR